MENFDEIPIKVLNKAEGYKNPDLNDNNFDEGQDEES